MTDSEKRLKRKEITDKLRIEILNYLAEHLSFAKITSRFPSVSMADIQEILYQSAEFFRSKSEPDVSPICQDFFLYTDGASRGNPGDAGAGAVIRDKEGNVIRESKEYLGKNTNNTAEYRGLILGLTEVLKIGGRRVHIFSDSELMVKQLTGIYGVKNEGLRVLYKEVNGLLKKFVWYDIKHISRERNKHADRLANEAIDEGSG
ncbi:MAG: ribonuclease HI family protein [Pseudomonadota bacterium]